MMLKPLKIHRSWWSRIGLKGQIVVVLFLAICASIFLLVGIPAIARQIPGSGTFQWKATPVRCGGGSVYSTTVWTETDGSLTCDPNGADRATLTVNGATYTLSLWQTPTGLRWERSDNLMCTGSWDKTPLASSGDTVDDATAAIVCTAASHDVIFQAVYTRLMTPTP